MDTVAVSRRNHTNKKGNKENTQPAHETKTFIKSTISKPASKAPLQPKGNEKDGSLTKTASLKARQADGKLASTEAAKMVTTLKKVEKAPPANVKQQRYSQAILAAQTAKHRKMDTKAPKPPTVMPPSKPAPGMYKGKIIQSKIGSIWKSSSSLNVEHPKPLAAKTTTQRAGNLTKSRTASAADRSTQKAAPQRSKSVLDRATKPMSKPPVASRQTAGSSSARPVKSVPTAKISSSVRPVARSIPTTTRPKNATVGPTKRYGTVISKPKVPVTDKKANRPVTSTLSQYRRTTETAEEKKAKLAEWLASKGKTLKRPAMVPGPLPKTKTSAKPEAENLTTQSQSEPNPPTQSDTEPEPEPCLETHRLSHISADHQAAEVKTANQTPDIMNISLDLLENSDADLPVDSQETVDDIVINLCEALEAMETPSRCQNEPPQVTEHSDVEVLDSVVMDDSEEELKNQRPEHVEEKKSEQVWSEEETEELKLEDSLEEVKSDDVKETTPPVEDASVVKYSVKTTPYLQSVKKTLEDEVSTSTSRRKSNISDIKFLTPVRRSTRIQRKSSRLPAMLVDHDPCVTSLAELVTLDDNPNAYIYRKNPAVLEDLPDQPRI